MSKDLRSLHRLIIDDQQIQLMNMNINEMIEDLFEKDCEVLNDKLAMFFL
jgi:hypothetical protein